MALKPEVNQNDHIEGSDTASLLIVEYGDYQCPHCKRAQDVVAGLRKKFGTDLKFVFRNFPLVKIHPEAMLAAVATEAAARQNKFWELHHLVFEHQDELSAAFISKLAGEMGLDIKQFEKDMEDKSLTQKVEDDFESGIRSGVNATPTFFINGEKYNNGWEADRMATFIKENYGLG